MHSGRPIYPWNLRLLDLKHLTQAMDSARHFDRIMKSMDMSHLTAAFEAADVSKQFAGVTKSVDMSHFAAAFEPADVSSHFAAAFEAADVSRHFDRIMKSVDMSHVTAALEAADVSKQFAGVMKSIDMSHLTQALKWASDGGRTVARAWGPDLAPLLAMGDAVATGVRSQKIEDINALPRGLDWSSLDASILFWVVAVWLAVLVGMGLVADPATAQATLIFLGYLSFLATLYSHRPKKPGAGRDDAS